MNDKIGNEETAEEADTDYMKGNNDNELKLIKDFITKINNNTINNKNKAGNEFRKSKQKITNDRLRQDLIKDFERYIFGEDLESIEPEEKYEESIAERVKTRKQNAPSRSSKKDYSAEAADYLKYMEEQEPILLAQIQAGNSSNKLKNEIRQILYSLYRSKVLTETVYNNLIKAI